MSALTIGDATPVALDTPVDLTVVIVNWNTVGLLDECIDSVHCEIPTGMSNRIVVVDNASDDGSVEWLEEHHPDVVVMRSAENVGFCRANNMALRATRSELVLLINTDARLTPGSFDAMRALLDADSQAAIVGPRLEYGDGSFQRWTAGAPLDLRSAAMYFSGLDRFDRWSRAFSGLYLGHDTAESFQAGWVSSAVMLIRRSALDEIGLLDDSIFVYMDDVDLCDRALRGGWNVWYAADATAVHFMGASTKRVTGKASPEALRALNRWFTRRHGRRQGRALRAVETAGFGARVAAYRTAAAFRPDGDAAKKADAHLAHLKLSLEEPMPVDTVDVHDRHDHEAETYDAMAEWILATWTDEEFLIPRGPIPFANREHVDYLTHAIDQIRPLAGKRILEVGAGGGSLAAWLAHEGAEVVGIDVSAGILDVARKRAEVSGVGDRCTFVHTPIEEFTAEAFPEAVGGFDAIIGNNVVHHFDRGLAMSRLAALLRPDAIATFCEPMLFVPEFVRSVRYSGPVAKRFPPHTHTEDERSLNDADLEIMREHFAEVEWKPFQVTARLQNFVELSDRMWNRLESFDRKLLASVPAARRLCRMAVITLAEPHVNALTTSHPHNTGAATS